MKINIFLIILLIPIVFSSCEDLFTSVKEIDIPQHDSKIAVFAELTDNFGTFSVSYSKIITDNKNYEPLDAEITVLENGNPFYKMSFKGSDPKSFIVKDIGKKIKEGNEYTLSVENDKYGKATSVQIVPEKPNFLNLKYNKDGHIAEDGFKQDLFSFEILDDANIENYYMIELSGISILNNNTHEDPLYSSSDDPSVKDIYFNSKDGLIISDKNFNGRQTKILTNFYSTYNLKKIKLRLYSITKDYYHFLLSYDQYQGIDENPFAEPVNIHNNIENGYGLFYVSSYKDMYLEIE